MKWTQEEESLILDYYISKGPTWLSSQINRTPTAIKNKAKRIGIISHSPIPWSDSEIEFMIANYSTRGCKWVCDRLNRTKGSVGKKAKDLNLKVTLIEKDEYSYDKILNAVRSSSSMSQLCEALGKVKSGASFRVIKKHVFRHRIDISHFSSYTGKRVITHTGKSIYHYLICGSSISSNTLKQKLYKENLKQRKCERCGQGEKWQGEKMSLILDHINGDPKDNRLKNLRIVCPNCNATLPTHCRGKRAFVVKESEVPTEIDLQRERNGGRTDKEIASSLSQRRVERPSREVILADTKELGFKGASRKYGVSDNAIRKWLK